MEYKMRFTTIGYIERHKGQDILIEALEKIPQKMLAGNEFLLVGQNSSMMAQALGERIRNKPWIRMVGTVSRKEIHQLLDSTDVLICPSRQDSMPTVCAEAMLHRVPCLVSDAVGTAAYLSDGVDSLIFKSGDTEELRKKILWCVKNKDALKRMGDEAYKVYEKIFSMCAFEESLLAKVEEMLR